MSLLNAPYEDMRSPLRMFRRLTAASRETEALRRRTTSGILWGVTRREGCLDLDDPKAHAGLVQHAFALGNDERAVCGYRPPRRRSAFSKAMRVELTAPSPEYNPPCGKCLSRVGPPPLDGEPAEIVEAKTDVELIGAFEVRRAKESAAVPVMPPVPSGPILAMDPITPTPHAEPEPAAEPFAAAEDVASRPRETAAAGPRTSGRGRVRPVRDRRRNRAQR